MAREIDMFFEGCSVHVWSVIYPCISGRYDLFKHSSSCGGMRSAATSCSTVCMNITTAEVVVEVK